MTDPEYNEAMTAARLERLETLALVLFEWVVSLAGDNSWRMSDEATGLAAEIKDGILPKVGP